MSCNDEFRHVCLKDLKHYFKKDDYFGDLSKDEIALIQKNLGITTTTSDDKDYNPVVIVGTYEQILNQAQTNSLKIGYVYVISDFRSIYLDKENNILGINNIPSEEYQIYLNPSSTGTFDKRVTLKSKSNSLSNSLKWEVEYDITQETFSNGSSSKGRITYLKDENNNSAYYDFKNIRFLKKLSELNKGAVSYNNDMYFYTFDDGNGNDSSSKCKNNHLEKGVIRTVFLGNAQNVYIDADAHDNIFFKNVENCHLGFGFYNNFVIDNMKNCNGSVHNCTLSEIISMSCPKKFDILNDKQVIAYLDSQTQTYQFKKLN